MSSHRIVVATGNPGKLMELAALLSSANVKPVAQTELGVPEAIEDGLTFVENALIKARNAALHTNLPAVADDSGLVVDALGGQPGIYSARYAGPDATDTANNEKLLERMAGIEKDQRRAHFVCAAVFLSTHDDPLPIVAQGIWTGRILSEGRGDNGFGYDPLFLIDNESRTSAELSASEKNQVSHRAKAMQQLTDALLKRLSLDSSNALSV